MFELLIHPEILAVVLLVALVFVIIAFVPRRRKR
jgi:hypothetical protein